MRRLLSASHGQAACDLHEVIENGVYPYRCSNCGQCFVCGHWLIGMSWWVCSWWPFRRVSTRPSPGVPV